jgi:uncharacterized repeat protein (TIGR02543 family)
MKKNIKFLLISFLVVANVIFLVLFNNKISAHEGLGGITMSDADFTEDDIVIDVDPNKKATGTNHGRTFYFLGEKISAANTDAFGFRIKNITDTMIPIQTVYISFLDVDSPNNIYSLMHSTIKFLWTDGRLETTQGNVKGRDIKIPADFDGIMIIDWDQLVTVRHPDFNNGNIAYFLRDDADKLVKNGTGYKAFPTNNLSAIHLFFSPASTVKTLEATNELIIGDPITFNYTSNTYIKYSNTTLTLTPKGNVPVGADTPWVSNVGYYNVINYPTTTTTYNLKINGVSGYQDETINLNLNSTSITLKFGYKLNINPTLTEGYTIGASLIDGIKMDDLVIRNKNITSKTQTINIVTAPFYTYEIGSNNTISLNSARGIMVDVNNTLGEVIEFSLIIKDTKGISYTASNRGVGIFITDSYSYYGDVFSIPVNFSGKIFIPFNVKSTGSWVSLNNKPFDKDKPSAMKNIINVNYKMTENVNHESLNEVFSNWSVSTETPVLSRTPIGEAEGDYSEGFAFHLNESLANNTWRGIPRLYCVPTKQISLGGLGLGFRFKNVSTSPIQLRLNILGSNGATYSHSYPLTYTRIEYGTNKADVFSGLAIIIPAGFDGTFIYNLNQLGAGNLSVIGEDGSSVGFQNVDIAGLSFYLNATSGDLLYVNPTVITFDYEGNKIVHENALSVEGSTNFTNPRMSAPLAITSNDLIVYVDGNINDNSKVEITQSRLTLGDTLVVKTKPGFIITSALLDGEPLFKNPDGSYELYIIKSYTGDLNLKITTLERWNLSLDFNQDELVNVFDLDGNPIKTLFSPNETLSFTVEAKPGYQITNVSVNNQKLHAVNGIYTLNFTADTNLQIETTPIQYNIFYHLDGGVNNEYNPSKYNTSKGTILLNPTKKGYEFLGWYTLDENNNKIEVVRILPGTTNDLEFYASWQRVESKKTELLKWSLITISSSIIVIGVGVMIVFVRKRKIV